MILATATLSLLALHCSSDDGAQPTGTAGTTTQPTSGSGGTASQAGSSSAGMTTGGVTTAGTASGGTGTAGTLGTAGAAGSAGAPAGGGGGTGGGASGSGGGGGTGGGSAATFAQVKDLLAMSCKGAKCHDAAAMQIDWVTSDGLYQRLTSPIPADIPHCAGDTPVVAGMADQSLLVRALKGSTMCSKAGGGMEQIGRMPDNCGKAGNPPCLTETQIKLVSDWVAAGAKM